MSRPAKLNKLISEITSDSHYAIILLEESFKCSEKYSLPQMFTKLALRRIKNIHKKYEEINTLFEV